MPKIAAIVLAAGEGTRMKSKKSKVLHEILGKEMINWVVTSAKKAEVEKIAIITGKNSKEVKQKVEIECEYFIQEKRLGTGHAVVQAKDYIKKVSCENIIVLYGDVPLISATTIKNLAKYHQEGNYGATILTAHMDNPIGYGRIVKDNAGNVLAITEQKDATDEIKKIKEINSGLIVFDKKLLLDALNKISNDNAQGEYYLTDAIEIIRKAKKVGAYKIGDNYEIFGVNDRVDLSIAEKKAREIMIRKHQLNGVTIKDPSSTFIGPDVLIERDVTIYQNTRLEKNAYIKEDCCIGPDSQIIDSTVGSGTTILKSTVVQSKIGSDTTIGPYAYIRPESVIGDNVKIGDFVEIKKSSIGDKTKISHLTYVGDAEVGENCNFGCGVVVVNYDGKKKNKTIIGNNAFIGCNVNLVSPVEIEDDTYIAAGSTITNRVEKNALAIARARQVNKKDWVIKRSMQRK